MNVYKFGPYFLSKESALLLKNGTIVPLTRRRYEILSLLLERAGQIVSKDEIIETIWRGQLVDESNLAQLIHATRRLLGDTVRDQTFIETIPGVGYRFGGTVEQLTLDDEVAQQATAPPNIPQLDTTPPTPSLPQAGQRRQTFVLIGSVALTLAVTAFLLTRGPLRDWSVLALLAPTQSRSGMPTFIKPVITLPGIKWHPAFSANGRYLTFSWNGDKGNNHNIFYVDLNEGSAARSRQLTSHPGNDSHPVWSPMGDEIAFLRIPEIAEERYHLIIASIDGRGEREVGRVWGGLDWSPDGQFFAVSESDQPGQSTGIFLLSRDGASKRPLSRPDPELNLYDSTPRFSPDGSAVAFVRWINDHAGDLYQVVTRTGEIKQLTFDKVSVTSLQWHPNGRELLFTSNRDGSRQLWRVPADGGSPAIVVNAPYEIQSFDISPQNLTIAYTSHQIDVDISVRDIPNRPGSSMAPCTIKSSGVDHSPNFSPDNRLLLFESNRSGKVEIWMAGADCTEPIAVTSLNDPSLGSSRWSPDGRQVIFSRATDGKPQIYLINADGSGLRQITRNPSNNILPDFSHDGRWIFFSSDRLGKYDIWRIAGLNEDPTRVTFSSGLNPVTSDDGRYLFYTRNELLRRIELRTGTDEAITELSHIKVSRHWALGGDHIYYATVKSQQQPAIYRLNLTTRKTELLFRIEDHFYLDVPGLSVSSDERRIAFSHTNYSYADIFIFNGFE